MNEKPIIGITTGDLNGIGLEVIIKTLSDTRIADRCTPVIFASNKVINYYRRIAADSPFTFNSIKDFTKINTKQINIFNCWEEEVAMQPGVLTDLGGKYAVRSLTVAAQCLKDGQVDALVTAPINKANTQSNDFPFTGHTPYLKNLFSANDALMILYKDNFRVALATEHIPIAEVAKHITKELINAKLQTLRQSLQKDFGIDKPKIAVLGMNPHAGDNGTIGKEEELILKPTIDTLFQQGHLVFGPYSADAFFARGLYQEFDAVLAMYHDQGLVAFKTIAQGEGVNYTAGLSKVRTSPDHGTAFDIAGKNEADPNSFREALFSAIDILKQREAYATHTANPLRKAKIEVERGVV